MIPPYSLDFAKGKSKLDVLEIQPQINTDNSSVFIYVHLWFICC